jgi:polyisoprenoid-binding protein YceI
MAQSAETMKLAAFCLAAPFVLSSLARAQAPVYTITQQDSSVNFSVSASIPIAGKFDKWDATLMFSSPNVASGVLDIKAQAASVDTGSGMKDDTLRSGDFFNSDQDPLITFHSIKIVRTGSNTFDVPGVFKIRGVSRPQTLKLTISDDETSSGEIIGTMAFDRKDYGVDGSILFLRIANRVEVTVDLHAKRVSGAPLIFKK